MYRAYVRKDNTGKERLWYAVKSPIHLKQRKHTFNEAAVYFKLGPADCPHLSLLSDVVQHPSTPNVPLLVVEWSDLDLVKWMRARHCSWCWKNTHNLQQCKRCKWNKYCGVDCQRSHCRTGHKATCGSNSSLKELMEIVIQVLRGLVSPPTVSELAYSSWLEEHKSKSVSLTKVAPPGP